MDDKEWVRGKLEDITTHLGEINTTLALNTAALEEHQRRSIANEKNLDLLRKEFKPIALHVAVVGALGKLIGIMGTGVGLIIGILKLLGKL